jgi:hypothetical protein
LQHAGAGHDHGHRIRPGRRGAGRGGVAAFDQGQRQEAGDLLVALGQPLGADALAQALDLFLVGAEVAPREQVEAGLAAGGLVGPGVADEVEEGNAVVPQVDAQAFRLREESLAALGAI